MRIWTGTLLVPLLVALRAAAHGYVSKIVIDGVAYAGNEPNDDTGECVASFCVLSRSVGRTSWWRHWLCRRGCRLAANPLSCSRPRCALAAEYFSMSFWALHLL